MKTILLTGGTGFLGSHLLHYLVDYARRTSDYDIIVLKRSFSNTLRVSSFLNDGLVRFVDIDRLSNLTSLFEDNNIKIIIHTATDYGRNEALPSRILESNLIFPLSLLEQGCKFGLDLFINTDSYFNKPNQTYRTLLDYSLSKKSLNLWLEYLAQKCKIINLRLEHLYGGGDSNSKFCEHIFQKVAVCQNASLELTGGEQKRDFVYIDDVCKAYITVLENYAKYFFSYLTFDVGTGAAVSIRKFVECVKEFSGSNTKLDFGSLPYRDDEIMISKADITSLLNWGFKAETSYKQGIEQVLKLYMKQKEA